MMELDIPLHVHTGVKTTHLKPIWLGESHFEMWQQNASEDQGRIPVPKVAALQPDRKKA
jgi:hypothetical protein